MNLNDTEQKAFDQALKDVFKQINQDIIDHPFSSKVANDELHKQAREIISSILTVYKRNVETMIKGIAEVVEKTTDEADEINIPLYQAFNEVVTFSEKYNVLPETFDRIISKTNRKLCEKTQKIKARNSPTTSSTSPTSTSMNNLFEQVFDKIFDIIPDTNQLDKDELRETCQKFREKIDFSDIISNNL